MAQTATQGLPRVDGAGRDRLLKDVLKGVSRSFYLTIRVLPKDLREPMGLAYPLARAGDTIADRRAGPRAGFPGQRLESLLTLRSQVSGPADLGVLQELVSQTMQGATSPKERALFGSLVDTFSLLESLEDGDRERVRGVVMTLTQGMEMDLKAFPAEDSGEIAALPSAGDLDSTTSMIPCTSAAVHTPFSTNRVSIAWARRA